MLSGARCRAMCQTSTTRLPHKGLRRCSSEKHVGELITVKFTTDDVWTHATPGQNLLEVASQCGVSIPTGCLSGSCGACEVEFVKYDDTTGTPSSSRVVVRACITKLPPGYQRVDVEELRDPIWGVDGFNI